METRNGNGRELLSAFITARTTQAKFARDVGCSESHLSLVLNGQRGLSLGLAKRISTESGIPVEKLPHEKLPNGEAV